MRIKVDEDLPGTVVEACRAAGHDAFAVVSQGMGGWKDPALWVAVQREGRFLITSDKGFGDIRAYPPGTHAGVLVLRPDEDGIRPLTDLFARVVASHRLDEFAGTVTVATPRATRSRKAPRN